MRKRTEKTVEKSIDGTFIMEENIRKKQLMYRLWKKVERMKHIIRGGGAVEGNSFCRTRRCFMFMFFYYSQNADVYGLREWYGTEIRT